MPNFDEPVGLVKYKRVKFSAILHNKTSNKRFIIHLAPSSGIKIPRGICTRYGRYLYSTKCSWIIKGHINEILLYSVTAEKVVVRKSSSYSQRSFPGAYGL